jgi:arylsulfatase A-like enzyme
MALKLRWAVLAALFLSIQSGCADSRTAGPQGSFPEHPHPIIIVDVDTLGAKHLGTYGYPRNTSPNTDAFAQQAIRFEWAFSQAPNTPPSQTSILTGLYPSTHGMIADEDRVPQDVTTLAEALHGQGFRTSAFVDGGYMAAGFGHDQGFDSYLDFQNTGLEKIAPAVDRWLEENAATESFFLLIHTYDVHWPYDPPEPYRSMFLAGLAAPTPGFEPTAEFMEALRRDKPRKLPENDLEYAKALYDASIRYVDAWFGKFLERVKDLGLLERATIVFLSDHGEEFQEHGSVGHDRLYATVTRIPLLLRLPGGVQAGSVSQVVEGIDVMPTLLELTGIPVPSRIQGRSLLPLRRGERNRWQIAISESPFFGERRAIAAGNYRLILTRQTGRSEIYRFRNDPDEQIDVTANEPQATVRLRQILEDWQQMIETSTYTQASGQLDADTREQLKALGYVD